jgi:hypothetical protein
MQFTCSSQVQLLVYARHGRDLKGESPLWSRYPFVRSNIAKGKPLVQGKGGFARNRLKEARSTKPRADEQEPHIRPTAWGRACTRLQSPVSEQGEVNAAVVRGRITFLFGEACLHCGTIVYGNPDVVSTTKGVGCLPVPGRDQMQRLSAINQRNRRVTGRSQQRP